MGMEVLEGCFWDKSALPPPNDAFRGCHRFSRRNNPVRRTD